MEISPAHTLSVQGKFFCYGPEKYFVHAVSYGPFVPTTEGSHFPSLAQVDADLNSIRDLGLNALRLYHVPPSWFLDQCLIRGLRCWITIPWADHVEFLSSAQTRKSVYRAVRTAIRKCAEHSAVQGFYVGNEVPAPLVRWMGLRRVNRFLEELIDIGRQENSQYLYAYANYPPTEYLFPENSDFFAFNLYLHHPEDYERYLLRIQNLSGDKPLVISEFGMDTRRHGQAEQAKLLEWHLIGAHRLGLAGTTIFAYTDEWYTGGKEVLDWDFGLVERDRSPKASYFQVQALLPQVRKKALALHPFPKVSVIICAYNAARTLRRCLQSIAALNYPNFEVIVVDDGSTDDTPKIAEGFSGVLFVRQENAGLSAARNYGAQLASGEILAYTDSDCMVDSDWLLHIVRAMETGGFAGVGGPNLSPSAISRIQASVAAAPGAPTHILINDTEAEHIPGCNMAFYRWAYDLVGGFDPQFRTAGDDVDFCWRLQQNDQRIGFSPAALVWHYRRFTWPAYFHQQMGYGEAEALLRFKHWHRFSLLGGAMWRGVVYGNPPLRLLRRGAFIYQGTFGYAPFQFIYPSSQGELAATVSSLEWVVLAFLLGAATPFVPLLGFLPVLMLAPTIGVAANYALRARVERKYDGFKARLFLFFLAYLQPILRGWSRYESWLKARRSPSRRQRSQWQHSGKRHFALQGRWEFWSDESVAREDFLHEYLLRLHEQGWRYLVDPGWKPWDLQIYGTLWWLQRITTVSEYHGGPKCLTRVSLQLRPSFAQGFAHCLAALALLGFWTWGGNAYQWVLGFWGLSCVFLLYRAFLMRVRLNRIIRGAAKALGWVKLSRKK